MKKYKNDRNIIVLPERWAKVPVLGDIPIFGRLFRSDTISEMETEFIIAITSHLVDFHLK